VAVGVEDERGVVVAAVGPLARRAVVAAARLEGRGVELVHVVGALGRERDVRRAVRGRAEPERDRLAPVHLEADRVVAHVAHRVAERAERRLVERTTPVEVPDRDVHVSDRHGAAQNAMLCR
jgi:hypothetical protein